MKHSRRMDLESFNTSTPQGTLKIAFTVRNRIANPPAFRSQFM